MRAAESTQPLNEHELEALFEPVADAPAIVLAVSGGADSLALLDAVDRWRRRRRAAPGVVVATVDHGLRTGSRDDAASVAAAAKARDLPARVLTVSETLPEGNVEAAAREARYRLLLGVAREVGARHLLLAHHRDDQAETFLMRLHRGSGVFGLSAMRRMVESDGIRIFRPFLDLPRSRLAATTAVAGLVPVEDPMNSDPRFLRARVRRVMPLLAETGMGAERLAAMAARCALVAKSIEDATDRLIAQSVTVDDFGVIRLEHARFRSAAESVRLRLLVRAIMAVGGERYPPRFQRLKSLHDAVMVVPAHRFKRTLGGAVTEISGEVLAIYRETGREGLPEIAVGRGFRGVWDHRFRLEFDDRAPGNIMLGPLGVGGRAFDPAGRVSPAALATQPAIRRDGDVVCVPTLAGHGGSDFPWVMAYQIVGERLSAPPGFPSFADP